MTCSGVLCQAARALQNRSIQVDHQLQEAIKVIDVLIFSMLVFLYLVFNRDNLYEMQAIYATAFMATYLVIYLCVPPKLIMTSPHLGQAFGYVPAVSFGAILFPELNTRFPTAVTRLLGWLGLLVVFAALCTFKLFVWHAL